MSCVMSVVGICLSDDGLKISLSQNAQTPANEKHDGHGDPCLILKFLIRFNTTALFWGILPYTSTRLPLSCGSLVLRYFIGIV